ncbi:hypothetical protein MRX96_049366 [Rhipicephalus microplus]
MSFFGSSFHLDHLKSLPAFSRPRPTHPRSDNLYPLKTRSQRLESDADGVVAVEGRKFWSRKPLAEDGVQPPWLRISIEDRRYLGGSTLMSDASVCVSIPPLSFLSYRFVAQAFAARSQRDEAQGVADDRGSPSAFDGAGTLSASDAEVLASSAFLAGGHQVPLKDKALRRGVAYSSLSKQQDSPRSSAALWASSPLRAYSKFLCYYESVASILEGDPQPRGLHPVLGEGLPRPKLSAFDGNDAIRVRLEPLTLCLERVELVGAWMS